MGEKAVLSVSQDGRITLPPAARRALELAPGAQVECEVVDGAVVLRRADIPAEDAWLYRPATVTRLKQAEARARTGRRWQVAEAFMVRLAAAADAAQRDGGELSREALDRLLAEARDAGEIEQVLGDAAGAANP